MTSSIILLTANTAPVAPSGHRTVTFWWKTSKSTGKMLSPKKYSHIPIVSIPGQMDDKSQLSIFIRSAFEDAQDDYLKSLIENSLGKTEFSDIELSFASVMNDYFTSKKTGGRLDGDSIEEWFISDMMELLQIAVEGKIGTTDSDKVATIVVGYKDKYKKLASGAVKYPQVVAENLLKNIRLVTSENTVKDKLISRLEPMTKVVTAESEGLI
jgi:hypothetical protein